MVKRVIKKMNLDSDKSRDIEFFTMVILRMVLLVLLIAGMVGIIINAKSF